LQVQSLENMKHKTQIAQLLDVWASGLDKRFSHWEETLEQVVKCNYTFDKDGMFTSLWTEYFDFKKF